MTEKGEDNGTVPVPSEEAPATKTAAGALN